MSDAIEQRFLNFQPETLAAIRAYQSSKDPSLIRRIVQGIIDKYLPEHLRGTTQNSAASLNAFGLESITLMEVVLDIQDALEITLTDDELRQLRSFDETIVLLSKKVSELQKKIPPSTTPSSA